MVVNLMLYDARGIVLHLMHRLVDGAMTQLVAKETINNGPVTFFANMLFFCFI